MIEVIFLIEIHAPWLPLPAEEHHRPSMQKNFYTKSKTLQEAHINLQTQYAGQHFIIKNLRIHEQ